MRPQLSRRRALQLCSVGLGGFLAGCSTFGADPSSGEGRAGDGDGNTDTATGDQDDTGPSPVRSAVIGDLTTLDTLGVAVTAVDRVDRAPLFGTVELPPSEGNEFLAVDLAFSNENDRYLAVVADLAAVATADGTYDAREPFVDLASPDFGGLAFAPGELKRERLHFEIPEGSADPWLRLQVRVRALPSADFDTVDRLQVDLSSTASQSTSLDQSFRVPFQSLGDTVLHEGVEFTLSDAVVPVAVPGRTPPEGDEFLALAIEVRNGGDLPNPIVVDVGGFGGISLSDGDGNGFGSAVRFNGEVAGGRRFDTTNGIAPDEFLAGIAVTAVPADLEPLYVLWTPPAVYWGPDRAVERNRYVWKLR